VILDSLGLISIRYTADVHRYLSTIAYSPIEAVSTCGPRPPPEKLAPGYAQEAPRHTAKIIQMTERMTDLLTLPVDLLVHSPFTICKIASPTIALIAACKHVLKGEDIIAARERIRVAIAAIEKFAEVWPRGAKTAKEVKMIARDILGIENLRPCPSMPPQSQFSSQHVQSSEAATYQDFALLDEILTASMCDLSGYGFQPNLVLCSADGSMTTDASIGVTITQ
jgi:hypothetical protein